MDSLIAEVCRIISEPHGEAFLRGMRDIYLGDDTDPLVLVLTESLGLTRGERLTATGYLVGNVAKEYCNWLDHDRRLPDPQPAPELIRGRDVVDVGCSYGRWLWHFAREARTAIGLEMQAEYVALGAALASREGVPVPRIVRGSVNELSRFFAPQTADTMFARLVFNHVKILPALRDAASILRSGGTLWLQVETLASATRGGPLGWAFAALNTAFCEITDRQLAIPHHGRMHDVHRFAYPGLGWWRRATKLAGFRATEVASTPGGRGLVVVAHR